MRSEGATNVGVHTFMYFYLSKKTIFMLQIYLSRLINTSIFQLQNKRD